METTTEESNLERELYFRPDVAAELFENEALLAFFEALINVDPQDHGTNFILSSDVTPKNHYLKDLDDHHTKANSRAFPVTKSSAYNLNALSRSIEELVTIDGITEIHHLSGQPQLGRSALYWDGGICDTLDEMGIPNSRPLYQRFGFENKVGTGTINIITASRHLPGYTVRLHDDGAIQVFKHGLIVGSNLPGEIKNSLDAYEAAAPRRHMNRSRLAVVEELPTLPKYTPQLLPENPPAYLARAF